VWRETAPAWIALLVAAAVAWHITLSDARAMGNAAGTMGMPLGPFLAMWTAMMAAMMFPSVAPVAILWVGALRRRSGPVVYCARTTLFVSGYLLAWSAAGLLAFAGLAGMMRLLTQRPALAGYFGAGLFAAAGLYQLTPFKDWCLRHCRSPTSLLAHYSAHRGLLADLWIGAHHGLYCLGCCWGLMVILAATGLMNLAVMIGLSAVIFLEKIWRHGPKLARATGVALVGLAILAWYQPGMFPGLRVTG
jgi:predicted metal-binding membrane protein